MWSWKLFWTEARKLYLGEAFRNMKKNEELPTCASSNIYAERFFCQKFKTYVLYNTVNTLVESFFLFVDCHLLIEEVRFIGNYRYSLKIHSALCRKCSVFCLSTGNGFSTMTHMKLCPVDLGNCMAQLKNIEFSFYLSRSAHILITIQRPTQKWKLQLKILNDHVQNWEYHENEKQWLLERSPELVSAGSSKALSESKKSC